MFGRELSDTAIISVPNGKNWSIGLTERERGIWFENRWEEFMEFYSIGFGHLLVFRHDGNSRFPVLIFNKTATEIEYPMHNFKDNFIGKSQVIELGSCSSSQSNNDTSTQRESSSSGEYGRVNLNTDQPADEHDFLKRQKVFANNTTRVAQSKERALVAAEAFRSEKPFFKAVMHASCVRSGGNMMQTVPASFASRYLKHKLEMVRLRVSDGRSWDIRLIFTEKTKKTTLSGGWVQFSSDNHLAKGDVCVFELVDRKKFEINVYIFRVSKTNFKDTAQGIDVDSCSSHSNNENSTQNESSSSGEYGQVNLKTEPADEHDYPKQRKVFAGTVTRRSCADTSGVNQLQEKALAAAQAFTSKKPFFKAIMQNRHINTQIYINKGCVYVPASFAIPYLKNQTTLVTLIRVADGESWDVGLISSGKSYLSRGWSKFAADNLLNVGDVCVFELFDRHKFKMNVHIFRVYETCKS